MKSDRDMMDTINKSVGNLGILRKKNKKIMLYRYIYYG